MWRILVPFLQFAVDCWLGLGAVTVFCFLLFGIGVSVTHRSYRRNHTSIL